MSTTKNDRQWMTDFILELRRRGVSGKDIGDAKASVESHLADSGERAGEAFGDPVNYADSLDLRIGDRAGVIPVVASSLLGILGLLYYVPAVIALVTGEPFRVGWLKIALFVVLALVLAFVARNLFELARKWWPLILIFALVIGLGSLTALLPGMFAIVSWDAPAGLGAAVSGTLILSSALLTRKFLGEGDDVVSPLGAGSASGGEARVGKLILGMAPWLMTIAAAVFTVGAFVGA